MAQCDWCHQEMRDSVGCTVTRFEDQDVDRIPNGDSKCHDCFAPAGMFHHPGCDDERCAVCGGQAISCECHDADEIKELTQ